VIEYSNPTHLETIANAANVLPNRAYDTCISRSKDGRLLGGVIYTNYTGASITMHTAGFDPAWVNRDMLWVCFHYPFVQLKCNKLFGQVPAWNVKALEFDLHLGFKEECIIRDVYPEGDMILLSMRKEDCRWLKLRPRTIAAPMEDEHGW